MTKPSRPGPEATLLPALAQLEPWAEFPASDEQRAIKAKFWLTLKANPIVDEKDVTPSLVEELIGKSVTQWTASPEFWTWFKDKDTTKASLEVAAEKAAELAVFYLNPAVPFNDNARVQLIKYVLEFSGRSPPSRKEIKWQDKDIAGLNEEQLIALIEKMTGTSLAKSPLPPKR